MRARQLTQDEIAARSLADAERRKARVLAISVSQRFATIEFYDDNGERIVADFTLFGYQHAPTETAAFWERWKDRQRKAKGEMTMIGDVNGRRRA